MARQRKKEQDQKDKKARAEELAAQRALKKQQRDAVTSQKCHDIASKGKRKASQSLDKKTTKRRCVVAAQSSVEPAPPQPPPPAKTTSRGRTIKIPEKFK